MTRSHASGRLSIGRARVGQRREAEGARLQMGPVTQIGRSATPAPSSAPTRVPRDNNWRERMIQRRSGLWSILVLLVAVSMIVTACQAGNQGGNTASNAAAVDPNGVLNTNTGGEPDT